MIAIFSFENDPTTDRVINWLSYLGADFIRINSEDIGSIDYFDFENGIIKFRTGYDIDLNRITISWYRRWGRYKKTSNSTSKYTLNEGQVFKEIVRESDEISEYIFYYLRNSKWLSNPFIVRGYNKLKTIEIASKVGLCIPKSLIIGDNNYITNNNYITKAISDGDTYHLNDTYFLKSFTNEVNFDLINKKSDIFFPSFLQKKIDRVLELRVFYIDNAFYTTAMIVGDNKNIDVKLATGANESPVSYVPYNLDINLRNKLKKLMKILKLNLGTFDLILDSKGDIYFIEMNPVGQFLGYSFPCNYLLEKVVAQNLMKNQ